ncbi:tetratricopeptide repeat protein 39B-like [Neodiprion virginianus]|uniref:tetratricopeptide repeat protein 39B-like n=1 Tax=Neodiprion virginianus TaxID=2961670 RepID=UPI001EE6989F|nr:tetratricopeptide repeat protein 39B-like [Neodiprion virginianus]XP_046620386.1 tetratricopeptide repeat protein 39B-like [Neodiprion virginianus]XP_046620387.1 tetratricopeptide repeat protein 39B-like [Neodiprion virginianus]XP_046620388.1 tetratricopeptide repeat protein 39B-like [Neodiprion virginianus]XP_046620390.1 tetratricopeptide repeat protein 39B-like [Neodiprion virginianus]XP_046620391.1 tetratricopeptide repeat protein 39B-like [Neodiprion virginianus]
MSAMEEIEAEDEFQDAQESIVAPTSMDLDTAMGEAKQAIHYFFNNDFVQARKILAPWAETSIYHALGHSTFAFVEAILTFEQKHIEKAAETLKQCMSVCQKHRRKNTIAQNIGKIVKKANYDSYTPEELHAELCYAEALLIKSLLTFMEDETLVSFVKAGFKIRTCYLSFKECQTILKTRKWTNDNHRIHFESGVRMGIGAFNLMISLLPGRIIKLLEFIGFSGDKAFGLEQLEAGYREPNGLRQVLCALTLLSFNLIVMYVLSDSRSDLKWCESTLDEELMLYPNGAWFLFFKGRLELVKGNVEEAVQWYTKSWKSQAIWPQFHHLCYWELMWAHCLQRQWDDALIYANHLEAESNWSKTIYMYQKAAILMMKKDREDEKAKDMIRELMTQVPTHKQRIAGKSLPMEKFVIRKAGRFFAQNESLVLPTFELLLVWNMFKVLGTRPDLLLNIFKLAEEEETSLKLQPSDYQADNEGLILLLKGTCLRHIRKPLQAEECLRKVLRLDKQIKEDTYLLPFAAVELALLARDQDKPQLAIALLEDTKKNYTGYSLESRLHFRIHSALLELTGKKPEEIIGVSANGNSEEETDASTSTYL